MQNDERNLTKKLEDMVFLSMTKEERLKLFKKVKIKLELCEKASLLCTNMYKQKNLCDYSLSLFEKKNNKTKLNINIA